MKQAEIREKFTSFFQEHNHHKVLSAPLVPARDPSLLFTNAGMNQFKSVFLQHETRDYKRAVSIQKCMRVSGKHNDFDEVGRTAFHHTFFEMMGNFSFGDYFKERAIEYAWELLTQSYGFDPERLWVSVFREDDEAYRIWEKRIGVPAARILRLDEDDNFWQMGDTGPCGPCSEVHFDRGEAFGPMDFIANPSRFVEIWNLVFMQFSRDASGDLSPLPAPSIDTGMGMERLASLLQGVSGNYETDLFQPIIKSAAQLVNVDPGKPENRIPLNVVADHIRALTFLISDGVLPSNDGRGYVLRRILRRAARHGRAMGQDSPFLHRLSQSVITTMKPFYPELEFSSDFISRVILSEEERFNQTLARGLKRFDELLNVALENPEKKIPGKDLFKLSDTYGFPLDFAVDLAREKDVAIDYDGFKASLEHQRNLSRSNRQAHGQAAPLEGITSLSTTFSGYDGLEDSAIVTGIYVDNAPAESVGADETENLILVFDRSPFYAEGGGQVGDIGTGHSQEAYFEITDTRKAAGGAFLHHARLLRGEISTGNRMRLQVNREHRKDTAVHHTSTHLLHAALRETLGLHVKQAGSYVGPEKLRFDFTHYQALTEKEITAIEIMVNQKIRENTQISSRVEEYETAISQGALAFFDEKYSDVVRVITVEDFSTELCGGTHLEATGEIGIFKIISESSISSGIRRIEALSGGPAFAHIQFQLHQIQKLQHYFHQLPEHIVDHLVNLDQKVRKLKRKLESLVTRQNKPDIEKTVAKSRRIGNAEAIVEFFGDLDRKQLSNLADELKKRIQGLAILFANVNGKSAITISVSRELTDTVSANDLIREVSGILDGSGGGRPDFAQAGGNRIEEFSPIRDRVLEILKNRLQ